MSEKTNEKETDAKKEIEDIKHSIDKLSKSLKDVTKAINNLDKKNMIIDSEFSLDRLIKMQDEKELRERKICHENQRIWAKVVICLAVCVVVCVIFLCDKSFLNRFFDSYSSSCAVNEIIMLMKR